MLYQCLRWEPNEFTDVLILVINVMYNLREIPWHEPVLSESNVSLVKMPCPSFSEQPLSFISKIRMAFNDSAMQVKQLQRLMTSALKAMSCTEVRNMCSTNIQSVKLFAKLHAIVSDHHLMCQAWLMNFGR